MAAVSLVLTLSACKPAPPGEHDANGRPDKCTENKRTNCVAGSGDIIGKGEVRRTLFNGKVIMPDGLTPEQNDPYPTPNAKWAAGKSYWEDVDKDRLIMYYAAWWYGGAKALELNAYTMKVWVRLDEDTKVFNAPGHEFQEKRVGVNRFAHASFTVDQPPDAKKPFWGTIYCAIYVWGPTPTGRWDWLLVKNQPGAGDAARFVDWEEDNPLNPRCWVDLIVP